MASITKRGGKWWVRWREGGKNRSETVRTKKEALDLRLDVEDALRRDGRYVPRGPDPSPTRLAVMLDAYLADSARRHAPATTLKLSHLLEGFRRWAGSVGVDALSFELLSRYHDVVAAPDAGRHGRTRHPRTVVKHFLAVEQAWKWAWQRQARGMFKGVPQPDSLKLKAPRHERMPAPTWAQMDACIAAAGGWQRDLYVVLRCTGLRVEQAMRLTWEDVDLDAATLRIRPELGKSDSEKRGRTVPLAPALVDELATWGRREGWLVPCDRSQRHGRPRDAAAAWERAGVPPVLWTGSPHKAFRRGFHSELTRAGHKDAAEYLVGHDDGIREHYIDPNALHLREAVALVPRVGPRVRGAYKARGLSVV